MNVELVPINYVFIGSRQRKEVDQKHIENLRADILQNGLIHAPTTHMPEAGGAELVAGFCRLKAIEGITVPYRYGTLLVEPGYVPIIRTENLTPTELFRIELSENLRRKNLSPSDEAQAIAALHAMLQLQNPLQTKGETAEALAEIQGKPTPLQGHREIGEALLISSFAEDPDVKAAKTKAEAVRIAKKKTEQQLTQALGAFIKPKANSDFTLLEGSCIELLPKLQPESFHGILCDPPYGVDADSFGEQSHAVGHQYVDTAETAMEVAHHIFVHGYRVCKSDAHLYMFCDIRFWPMLSNMAKGNGWLPFATPLIWHKPGLGHAPQPGFFGRRYECILFAQKGNRRLSKSASDVFVHPSVKDKVYAAQKPVELLKELMALSWFPGEHILDPTCGSGSVFRAAASARLKCTGIELNPLAVGLAKESIREASK